MAACRSIACLRVAVMGALSAAHADRRAFQSEFLWSGRDFYRRSELTGRAKGF
jgi:hypothetical protein